MTIPHMPANKTMTIANNETKARTRMWPSSEMASALYDWANWVLVVAAAVGVVSTILVIWMGKVKEEYLKRELANTNERTEELRKKNLAFEAAISPRHLEQMQTAEALSRFAGLPFVVVSPSDFEPKRTAGYIRFMLLQANWTQFTEPLTHPFAFFDGVTVHVMGRISKQDDPGRDAAMALVSILNDNGIQSTVGYPITPGKMPSTMERSSVLVVEVGPKPLPTSLQPSDIPADAGGVKMWGNIAE
jgi:hypothetical protein